MSGETPAIEGGASKRVILEFEDGGGIKVAFWFGVCDCRCFLAGSGIWPDDTIPNMHAAHMMIPTTEIFMRRTALARSACSSGVDAGDGWYRRLRSSDEPNVLEKGPRLGGFEEMERVHGGWWGRRDLRREDVQGLECLAKRL